MLGAQDDEIRSLRQEIAALKARLFVVERKLAGAGKHASGRTLALLSPPKSLIYAAGAMVLAVLLAQAMN